MKIFALVPAKKFENSKTRLSPMLSPEDRVQLSSIMLQEMLEKLATAPSLQRIVVVSSDERARELASSNGATFLHEEKDNGVNAAVELFDSHTMSHHADASIIIPQDLPLLDPQEIATITQLAETEEMCIVICPSQRYDGTNILLRKPPDAISTFFDRNSYENHIAAAKDMGVPVKLFLSKRLMMDVDTPEDARLLANDNSVKGSRALEFINQKDLKRAA